MSAGTAAAAVCLLFFSGIGLASGQSCTQDLLEPTNYPFDSSGVRASRAPPILVGSTVTYQCPLAKAYNGKTQWQLLCNEDEQYEFTPHLPNWPECQCTEDLSKSGCPQASYKMRYGDDPGEVPATLMTLNFPNTTKDWSMTLVMDMDVQKLQVDGVGIGLIPKSPKELVISPLGSADKTTGKAEFEIVYYFNEGNPDGTFKWKHPCIASIECEIKDDKIDGYGNTWVIIAIVTAIMVGMMILIFLVVYCFKSFLRPKEVEPMEESGGGEGVTNSTFDLRKDDNRYDYGDNRYEDDFSSRY